MEVQPRPVRSLRRNFIAIRKRDGGPVELIHVKLEAIVEVPGVGRASSVMGDGDNLPNLRAVHVERWDVVAVFVDPSGGDACQQVVDDGLVVELVVVYTVQRLGEALRDLLLIFADND